MSTENDIKARVERARELDEMATPAPWKADSVQGQACVLGGPRALVVIPWGAATEDAMFAAESRTLLPALAADCERLQARVAELESRLPK